MYVITDYNLLCRTEHQPCYVSYIFSMKHFTVNVISNGNKASPRFKLSHRWLPIRCDGPRIAITLSTKLPRMELINSHIWQRTYLRCDENNALAAWHRCCVRLSPGFLWSAGAWKRNKESDYVVKFYRVPLTPSKYVTASQSVPNQLLRTLTGFTTAAPKIPNKFTAFFHLLGYYTL